MGEPRVGRVRVVEAHPVLDAASRKQLAGAVDRRPVQVDPVDGHLGVAACDRDRRSAQPAGDVGDAGGRIGLEPFVDVRDRGQPLGREQVLEQRPGEPRLALVEVGAVVGVGDAVARPEGVEQRVDRPDAGDDGLRHRRDVVQARLGEERLLVPLGKRVPPLAGTGVRVVDLEDPAHRLLLEPLPGVPLVDAGRPGELVRRARALLGQCSIEAQPVADVDGEQVERPERRLEEALHEQVATLVGGRHRCHACLLRPGFRPAQPTTVPCLTARAV